MLIALRAEVHPTEDPDRVKRAIMNIFPDAVLREEGDTVLMESEDLGTLSRRIGEQMIRDTARAILMRSVRGDTVIFHLNKQAALVGRVNFTEGRSVLGDIEVRIEDPEAEAMARMAAEGA